MTTDSVGGVFEHAIDLAQGLRPLGFTTVLAGLGPRMDRTQREAAERVAEVIETDLPLDWLAQGSAELDRASAELAALAHAHDAAIVHLNTPGLASELFEPPVVVASHSCLATWWQSVRGGTLPGDFGWRTNAVTRSMKHADIVVCPTHSFAVASAQVHGRTTRAVHNGRAMGPPPTTGVPAEFAFTAGRLWDEGKDFRTLDIAASLQHVPILAAGSLAGPNGSSVDCRHAVSLGPLSQTKLREMLARRPVFVSAAVYETFGLAVLEAAQAGCALVLADIPAYRELWDDAAIFVPTRDAHAFADAIEHVMADRDLRKTLACAARVRAQRYTVEAMASGMAGIYAELGVVPA